MISVLTMRLPWVTGLLCRGVLGIAVYKVADPAHTVVLSPVQPLIVRDVFALCYRFLDTRAHSDNWRIDLTEGFYEYPSFPNEFIIDYKLVKGIWNFNTITTHLINEDPPDYFQLRWNNVCYVINYLTKMVSFFRNGKLVAEIMAPGLKAGPNSANITKITLLKGAVGLVSDANLIVEDVTPETMVAITSCTTFSSMGSSSWMSGAWKLVDGNGTIVDPVITIEEPEDSFCHQKPFLVFLPKTGFWPGKEKCNLLAGKAYRFTNDTERIEFAAVVQDWHTKAGLRWDEYPTLDITDDEEEGVWVSAETGEVIAIHEAAAPHRIAEHKYENWRPGQPNGLRYENNAQFDAYYPTGQGWVDGCSWCSTYYMTCQVGFFQGQQKLRKSCNELAMVSTYPTTQKRFTS